MSSVPRYLAIKNAILDEIQKGELLNNGRLPSEDELSKIFGVSRTTVRSALQALESEGIVEKKHGSGNFIKMQTQLHQFNSEFALPHYDSNALPVVTEKHIHQTKLDSNIAQKLKVPVQTDALEIVQLFTDRGEEDNCKIQYIPLSFFLRIPRETDLPDSLYELLIHYCGMDVAKIITDIYAVPAEDSPFKTLTGPVLKLEEVFLNASYAPVACSFFYINQAKQCPHIIRGKPPLYWRASTNPSY